MDFFRDQNLKILSIKNKEYQTLKNVKFYFSKKEEKIIQKRLLVIKLKIKKRPKFGN